MFGFDRITSDPDSCFGKDSFPILQPMFTPGRLSCCQDAAGRKTLDGTDPTAAPNATDLAEING